MSEFKKCKTCRGIGFKGRTRTVICPDCHGGGRSEERQRGYHPGHFTESRHGGSKYLCPVGHLKTGVTVDTNGNLYPYCEICHREVVRNNYNNKKVENLK